MRISPNASTGQEITKVWYASLTTSDVYFCCAYLFDSKVIAFSYFLLLASLCRARCNDKWLYYCKCQWWPESDEIWGLAVVCFFLFSINFECERYSDVSIILERRFVIWLLSQRLWRPLLSSLHLIIPPTGLMRGWFVFVLLPFFTSVIGVILVRTVALYVCSIWNWLKLVKEIM